MTSSQTTDTRILIVNPMPSDNDANAKCETRVGKYFRADTNARHITIDTVRLNVDVPKACDDEAPFATYSKENPEVYDDAINRLAEGAYHGVHILGASCDHVSFDNTHSRHLITDIFDHAIESETGIFTICNGSFEYLNYIHGVTKGVNIDPIISDVNSVNPQLLKIIGHFENAVTEGVANHQVVESFRQALRRTNILPTGRVGYMHDEGMIDLSKRGVLDILSTSPNMDGRTDAQISAVYDFKNKALCMAPHIEYGPNALKSEAERDHATPQGRTRTPALNDIPHLDVLKDGCGNAPWFEAGVALYAAWVEAINPAQNLAVHQGTRGFTQPLPAGLGQVGC